MSELEVVIRDSMQDRISRSANMGNIEAYEDENNVFVQTHFSLTNLTGGVVTRYPCDLALDTLEATDDEKTVHLCASVNGKVVRTVLGLEYRDMDPEERRFRIPLSFIIE